jgi:hypothetical protein
MSIENFIKTKLKRYLIDDLINISILYNPIQLWLLEISYGSYSDYRHYNLGICSDLETAISLTLQEIINTNEDIYDSREYKNNFNSETYDSKNNKWNFKVSDYIKDHLNFFSITSIFINKINVPDSKDFNPFLQINLEKTIIDITNNSKPPADIYIRETAKNYKPLQSFIKYVKENIKKESPSEF